MAPFYMVENWTKRDGGQIVQNLQSKIGLEGCFKDQIRPVRRVQNQILHVCNSIK